MRRARSDSHSRVEVAITPMLDMTFQLLFFFMLFYHPSALEGQMSMALPAEKQEAKAAKAEDVTAANDAEDDQLPADLTVQLKAPNSGSRTPFVLVGREGPQDVENLNDLLTRLKQAKADGSLKNADDITIKPDSKIDWKSVLEAMDVCTKAGFHVGFGAPPDRAVGQQ